MAPPSLTEFSTPSVRPTTALLLFIGGLVITYQLFLLPIYNVFFHPLRKFPGPKLWAATHIPWINNFTSGRLPKNSLALHDKYGPIVRVSPNELSFIQPEAWQAVMGHRKPGQSENGKAPFFVSRPHSLIGVGREDHTRMRRLISHGFSASSMLDQQPLIKSYVELLLRRLHDNCNGGRTPVDICAWYNYTTFDIIGDLAFGEPFGCLRESAMHPWVTMIFATIKTSSVRMALSRVPLLKHLLPLLVSPKLLRRAIEHEKLTREKVSKRLALQDPRPDFFQNMTSHKSGLTMSRDELDANSEVLIVAGSETTATALSGASYLLTINPRVMTRLVDEVRSSYTHEDEIDLLSSAKLPYLSAVVEETLRLYPPVPNALPRLTPPQGDLILGESIPGNTVLSIPHWAMYHSESNFKRAMEFIPERWLGDPEFANDRRECLQPFSFGPRNCLGKNLAYAEMRMILARVLWNFDIELAEESKDWINQNQALIVWAKPPLWVHLTPRNKA